MKAAPYRFYRHCTIDEDGIMTCHAGSGSELNISEEVFEFRLRDMESLNWMCSSDEAETVSIPSKSLQVTALTPTAYDVSFWKICTIGLIPGAFLLIGFMIWLKRRKA